ncbi:thiamine phosphate synthase [Sneathiella aquimaris]|uniref:thiamine phosphate synthase n=1 Tax=Sneathiella aquimaris TaxID=2599305 RepID=UPI002260EF24|nr:thiamine phosphate synthase [Sneathiella aquimaris]
MSPPTIDLDDFENAFSEAASGGDIACFQLRLKMADKAEIAAATERLMPIAERYGIAFLINDNPALAKELGTDGVHIGQEDMPYNEARQIVGDDMIVGVTCHDSRHLAMEAAERGADYVAFGAFYPTTTKVAKTAAEPEILQWWTSLCEIPCVAIGGITVDNAVPLIKSGADFLAISSGVWQHSEGPAHAVEALNRIIDNRSAT